MYNLALQLKCFSLSAFLSTGIQHEPSLFQISFREKEELYNRKFDLQIQ